MQNPPDQDIGQPTQVLVRAIRKILRPLVRLMLSYQISYPFVISLLKSVYIEVAESDFSVGARRPSDSRINLLTGVHRKDVKRLRALEKTLQSVPRNVSIGSQLIAYWVGTDKFLDEYGKPRALALRASGGNSSHVSFDELVEAVCKQDIRPRVILDEWLNLGVASLDEHNCVKLNTGVFTPEKGFEEKVFFFAKNIHDHISASSHNLMGNKPSYFDRSVYYDKLSASSVEALSKLANDMGMQALTAVNKTALHLQKQDADSAFVGNKTEAYRINFGVFNFNTPCDPVVAEEIPDSSPSDATPQKTNKGSKNA